MGWSRYASPAREERSLEVVVLGGWVVWQHWAGWGGEGVEGAQDPET